MFGTVTHLKQQAGGCREDERASGVHQLQAPARHEKWKVHSGVKADSEEYYAMLAKAGVHHYSGIILIWAQHVKVLQSTHTGDH